MCDAAEQSDEFYREVVRRCRVRAKCCACGEPIQKGDRYANISGKWDGEFMSFKQCLRCNQMMRGLADITDDCVDIQLDCGNETLEPGAEPEMDKLAFMSRAEIQALP